MSSEDTARDNYDYYRWCRDNGHEEYLQRACRATDFYFNRQWTPEEKQPLDDAGRPALTINKIFRTVDTMVSQYLQNRVDVRYTPIEDADEGMARLFDKLYLHVQRANDLDWLETQVFERGILQSRAYFDVRMGFDNNIAGDVIIRQLRSQNVILDPEIEDYNPETWPQVFTTSWMSPNDLELAYGKAKMQAVVDAVPRSSWLRPEDQYDYTRRTYMSMYNEEGSDPDMHRSYRLIERQYRQVAYRDQFIDVDTGDFEEVPENWDRDKIARVLEVTPGLIVMKRKAKTIRWTVSAGPILLHDEFSPYNRFTVVPFFPYFIDGESMGQVENLIDPQRLFNKVLSQELHIINTSANSGWKLKEGALRNMEIEELERRGAETGLVMVLDDIANAEKITPNSVPSGHDNMSRKVSEMIMDISGVNQYSTNSAREDVSARALETHRAAAAGNQARATAAFYQTKKWLAAAILDLVQTYYTDTRAYVIASGGVTQKTERVTLNEVSETGEVLNDVTRGKYAVTLVPTAARATQDMSAFSELLELRKLGVAIPDAALIEVSQVPRRAELLESMSGDSADAAAAKQAEEQALLAAERGVMEAEANERNASAEFNKARAVDKMRDSQDLSKQVEAAQRLDLDKKRLQLEAANSIAKHEQEEKKGRREAALSLIELREKAKQAKASAAAKPKEKKA